MTVTVHDADGLHAALTLWQATADRGATGLLQICQIWLQCSLRAGIQQELPQVGREYTRCLHCRQHMHTNAQHQMVYTTVACHAGESQAVSTT